jgi:uncharacterized protein YbjQ (UPF0145 family)
MILTTSPSVDGATITQYLKPISSHVVLGTNIFSDIAASWRDVFGGRSQSYQNQLKRLTDVALNELSDEAKKLRADAVIAIDLDFSDITGGGKAGMLMVVATGTAVALDKGSEVKTSKRGFTLDTEAMILELTRTELMDTVHRKGPSLTPQDVMKLTEYRVHEVWEQAFAACDNANYSSILESYVSMCSDEKGYEWTLDTALNYPSERASRYLSEQVALFDDFKLGDLLPYLGTRTESNVGPLFRLATKQQQFYGPGDAEKIAAIEEQIRSQFPVTITKGIEKKMMGKEKEIFVCQCGGKFNEYNAKCDDCGKNKWGLEPSTLTPDIALEALRKIRRVLERLEIE